MSNSDNVVRLPRIASTHTLVVEVDDMGSYSFTVPDNYKRAAVQYDRQQKREMAQSGSGRKAQIADLDTQEQMRDALLSPAYEGPVGTPKIPLWEHMLLSDPSTRVTDISFANVLPSREIVYAESGQGVYVSVSESLLPPKVKVEPVIPRTRTVGYLDRQAQEILRRKAERRAVREARDDLTEIARLRDMREAGFGGRYGVHLEG